MKIVVSIVDEPDDQTAPMRVAPSALRARGGWKTTTTISITFGGLGPWIRVNSMTTRGVQIDWYGAERRTRGVNAIAENIDQQTQTEAIGDQPIPPKAMPPRAKPPPPIYHAENFQGRLVDIREALSYHLTPSDERAMSCNPGLYWAAQCYILAWGLTSIERCEGRAPDVIFRNAYNSIMTEPLPAIIAIIRHECLPVNYHTGAVRKSGKWSETS